MTVDELMNILVKAPRDGRSPYLSLDGRPELETSPALVED